MKTFNDLLTNPSGKGTSQVSSRYSIIDDLNRRYMALKGDKKKFGAGVYTCKEGLLFYIRVPSESFPPSSIWYDVLLLLHTEETTDISKKKLLESRVTYWSNMPSFVFTYLNSSQKQGDLIDWAWLKSYTPKLSLKEAPVVKNPDEVMGFDKSIYFSLLEILEKKLYNSSTSSTRYEVLSFELPHMKKNIQKFEEVLEKTALWKNKDMIKRKKLKQQESRKVAAKSLSGKQTSIKSVKKVKKVKRL